jgi:hypothetical protein
MEETSRDEAREERILMEIIVDAYGPEERALGWWNYLDERLVLPFRARCIRERRTSPLRVGDDIEVVGMAPEEDCEHEMVVLTPWERRMLAVPLAQLEPLAADADTAQAIADWHYWVARGNEF